MHPDHRHSRLRGLLGALLLPFVVEAGMVVSGFRGIGIVLVPPVVVGFVYLVRAIGTWAAVVALVYIPVVWWLVFWFGIEIGGRLYGGDTL